MCKAPRPGGAKTRLARAIGAIAASELSACFLRDVAAAIEAVPETLGRKGYAVYAPAGTEQVLRDLFPEKFGLLLKVGDDLAMRCLTPRAICYLLDTTVCCWSTAIAQRFLPVFWFKQLKHFAARATGWFLVRQAMAATT
jgi:hypothetical protein